MAVRVEMERYDPSGHVVVATDATGQYRTEEPVDECDWPQIVEMSLYARSAKTLIERLDRMNQVDPKPRKRKEARP